MSDDSRSTLKYINKLSTFLRCVTFYTSLVVGWHLQYGFN